MSEVPRAPRRGELLSWAEEGRAVDRGLVLSLDAFNDRTGTALLAEVEDDPRHQDNPFAVPIKTQGQTQYALCHRLSTVAWRGQAVHIEPDAVPMSTVFEALHRLEAIFGLRNPY
ncbi:MAG: hypothetical protein O9327_10565 [Polaromonas sp.]|nr:hypothetical protein [Polaromonas sp.]